MGFLPTGPPVWLSPSASEKTKKLWWLHGHPHSETFANPALTSLASLIRWNAAERGSDVAFWYPTSWEEDPEYTSITWTQFDYLTGRIADHYSVALDTWLQACKVDCSRPTIALWGSGHSMEYFATQMAFAKLNVCVLLIADNAPESAVKYLLEITEAKALVTDAKHPADRIDLPTIPMVERWDLDNLEDLNGAYGSYEDVAFGSSSDNWNRQTFIIHSSGSTGLPKPIKHTNRSLMQIARMYRLFPEFHIENWLLLFPLYHIAGFSIILSGLPNGLPTTFPPRIWPPRPSSVIHTIHKLKSLGHPIECVHTAPVIIESLVESIERRGGDFSPLSELKVLQPGGAMLSPSLVKKLTKKGVNVKTTYGSTEIGPPLRSIPHSRENLECYRLANLYPENDKIRMEEVGHGLYECVVYNGFLLAAELWSSPTDNTPYRTRDLFIQDPPNSGNFYLTGRLDDVLIHTNGENTNAGPIELAIKSRCTSISSLVLLGHSKPCPCLLVEFHDPANPKLEELQETVEQVNGLFPKHSAIQATMIHVLPAGSQLPKTPKGNVKRKEAENLLAGTIDLLYDAIINEPKSARKTKFENAIILRETIRETVVQVLGVNMHKVDDRTSFYEVGLDSISAIKLRAALNTNVGRISLGGIFELPSVDRLVRFYEANSGGECFKQNHHSYMREYIERSCQAMEAWGVAKPRVAPEQECILLTGSSGSLGTALLESFSESPKIKKVFALVHGSNGKEKLARSMISRGMDAESIFNKLDIEVLSYSMTDKNLGLQPADYHRLSTEVTTVLHGAWKVDFNKNVEDFEDCLESCLTLVRFSMTGQTKMLCFVSSIAACMGEASQGFIHEEPAGPDLSIALGTGYAQSKYIVERICSIMAAKLSLPLRLFRLGQMYGHTKSGSWSFDEMFPIMIATSFQLGALPQFSDRRLVDWIPVDVAAGAMRDVVTAGYDGSTERSLWTHNIVNPFPIAWEAYLDELQSAIVACRGKEHMKPLERISMASWVDRLRTVVEKDLATSGLIQNNGCPNTTPSKLPIHGGKLLRFFEDMIEVEPSAANQNIKPTAPPVFDTAITRKISPSLSGCKAVNGTLLRQCMERWISGGFMDLKQVYSPC